MARKPASMSLLKKTKDRIEELKYDIDMESEYQILNPDDHGVRERTSSEIKKSKEKQNKMKVRLKALQNALKNMKPRGGGSVGGNTVGNLAAGSRNNAIKKLMKDM